MNSQLLVQVFVETKAGGWKRATGCVIASDRVVTAAHTFRDRKPGGKVRVRIYRKNEQLREARTIWPAALSNGHDPVDGDEDVAVLEILNIPPNPDIDCAAYQHPDRG